MFAVRSFWQGLARMLETAISIRLCILKPNVRPDIPMELHDRVFR